jgi:hypothetical protein
MIPVVEGMAIMSEASSLCCLLGSTHVLCGTDAEGLVTHFCEKSEDKSAESSKIITLWSSEH